MQVKMSRSITGLARISHSEVGREAAVSGEKENKKFIRPLSRIRRVRRSLGVCHLYYLSVTAFPNCLPDRELPNSWSFIFPSQGLPDYC